MIEIDPKDIPEEGFTVIGEGDNKFAICSIKYYVFIEKLLLKLKDIIKDGRKE